MIAIDFEMFGKQRFENVLALNALSEYDVFMSAFNTTDRVRSVFANVPAATRVWLIHSEYQFQEHILPTNGRLYKPNDAVEEDEFIQGLLQFAGLPVSRMCVDISGFMRPHLMFLFRMLAQIGMKSVDVIYSEPATYAEHERTEFATGDVTTVRPVTGFEGNHGPSLAQNSELLIIASGYEHKLIHQVATVKDTARKIQLMGFPPLQADFYQESWLNVSRVREAVSPIDEQPLLAPANDPFATANALHDAVEKYVNLGYENIYLSPLSTRPQALGFALYYMYEAIGKPVSVIYPFTTRYSPSAASGISRLWLYTVELP